MNSAASLTGPLDTAVTSGRLDIVIAILIAIVLLSIIGFVAFMIGRHLRSGASREASAQQTVSDLVRDLIGQYEKHTAERFETEREWREALKRDVERCETDRVKLSSEVGALMTKVSGLEQIIAKNGFGHNKES